jgi:hypothetical protein
MKEEMAQDCPLCGRPANYTLVSAGQYKYFSCQECKLFQVSLRAEAKLLKAPSDWRQANSLKSRAAPEGEIWVIRVPNSVPGESTASLHGEYVSIAKVPQ